jgi:2-iminobutanoate/2-iminopropanoate deaminase
MTVADLVKVTTYLTRADDIPAYAKVRKSFLGETRPAFTLLVVPQLVRPEWKSKSGRDTAFSGARCVLFI